ALERVERDPVVNDVDLFSGKSVAADDFLFHHARISDDALRTAFREKRFFESEGAGMLAIQKPAEFLERPRDFVAPLQPGAMDSVSSPINIAAPDPLQAHEDIAVRAR